MKKIIFFDFDGVIVDTKEFTFRQRKELEPSLTLDQFLGYFKGNIFDAALDTTPLPEVFARQRLEYSQKIRSLPITHGLRSCITRLAEAYALIIISSSRSEAIREYLRGQKMEDRFAEVLGSDSGTQKAEKMIAMLRRAGLESRDAAMVTDTLGDILEAKICGIRAIGVEWGFHPREILIRGGPDFIARSPGELESFIRIDFPS